MRGRVLVFPAGMPRSLSFRERAENEGWVVLGASSLQHDPAKKNYSDWCYLPFVTDDSFSEGLRKAVRVHAVEYIYTPNIVVWNYLNEHLKILCPGISLMNKSPLDEEVLPYHKAQEFARQVNLQPLEINVSGKPYPLLNELRVASIYHHSELIPGMCDHEKIKALFSVFRYCPKGDVVEIGSWWGKSAFIIASLAKCFGIGNVLCVDPWSVDHLKQGDEKGLVDGTPVDADEALRIFQINLMPFFENTLNYLRLPSVAAAKVFRSGRRVVTPSFGETDYCGRISMLHIDGNHSYASVREDAESWANMVVPGGWIIFDDYLWPYGDGPKRVADEYLDDNKNSIESAFLMGSALFLRKSS